MNDAANELKNEITKALEALANKMLAKANLPADVEDLIRLQQMLRANARPSWVNLRTSKVLEMKYIIILGNVINGLDFVGPFDTREATIEYGDLINTEWTFAELDEPEVESE